MDTPLDLVEIRKPVQICVADATDEHYRTLYALCDDGSIWYLDRFKDAEWKRVRSIPQGEVVREEKL